MIPDKYLQHVAQGVYVRIIFKMFSTGNYEVPGEIIMEKCK